VTVEQLQPFKDYILVKPDPPETMRNGIILIQTHEDPTAGVVVKLGPTARGVQVGDRVRFHAGKMITLAEGPYLLLKTVNPDTPDDVHTRHGIYGVIA